MMSQGASKTNMSMVVQGSEGQRAVQALHAEFFPKIGEAEGSGSASDGNGALN